MVDLKEAIGSGGFTLNVRYGVKESHGGYKFQIRVVDNDMYESNYILHESVFSNEEFRDGPFSIDVVADQIDRNIRDCVSTAVIMSMFGEDYDKIEDFK